MVIKDFLGCAVGDMQQPACQYSRVHIQSYAEWVVDMQLEGAEGCHEKHVGETDGKGHTDGMGRAEMSSWIRRLDPEWSPGLPGVGMDYVI